MPFCPPVWHFCHQNTFCLSCASHCLSLVRSGFRYPLNPQCLRVTPPLSEAIFASPLVFPRSPQTRGQPSLCFISSPCWVGGSRAGAGGARQAGLPEPSVVQPEEQPVKPGRDAMVSAKPVDSEGSFSECPPLPWLRHVSSCVCFRWK